MKNYDKFLKHLSITLLITQIFVISSYTQNMSNTTISTCSTMIYDDGGPSGNYTETNYTMTVCADSGTELYIVLESLGLGTAFNGDSDILIIYQGTGTGGPVLFDSQVQTAPTGIIQSNDPCITITLDTDPAFFATDPGIGFELLVSCLVPETCSDGILNNGEVQIDCGGPNCTPCYQPTACDPNVVDNGDFEGTTVVCGAADGGIYGTSNQIPRPWFDQTPVQGWFGTANRIDDNISFPSPDYLNSNCTNASAIACMNGTGSLGMWVHFGGNESGEYVQTLLNTPLEAGEEYCVSVRTSTKRGFSNGGPPTDKLGFWFHNNTYSNGNGFIEYVDDNGGTPFLGPGTAVNGQPQIVNPAGQMITEACQDFNYSFCPAGGEQYLIIGNFTPGNSASGSGEYVAIDDLVITKSCPLAFDSQIVPSGTPDCAGSCVDLEVQVSNQTGGCEVTNDFTYQWFENGVLMAGETGTMLTSVCPTATVTYSVEITYSAGCKTYTKPENETAITFNCSSFLVDVVANPDIICEGECSDLTATPDIPGSYTYSWTEQGNANVLGTSQTLNVCPTVTTTYNVEVSDGNETVPGTVTVTVNPALTPTFDPVADLCEGAIINPLPTTSNDGVDGTWSPAIDNTNTTTYTFTPDAGQCAVPTDLTITVNPISNTVENISVCSGSTVTYPDGTSAQISGPTSYVSTLTTSEGCDSIITTNVTLNPAPIFGLSSTDPTSCTATDGTITLSGLLANTSYIISYNGNPPSTMSTDANGDILISGLATGSYSNFTVEDPNGCTATDNSILNISPVGSPTIDEILKLDLTCFGDHSGEIQITASGGTGALSYTIDDGQGFTETNATGSFINLSAGTYTVTVTDAQGCEVTDIVVVNEPGAITQQFTSTDIACFGDNNGTIDWINVSGGTLPYQYSVDDGITYSSNATFNGLSGGTYFLTVQDQNGCNSDTQQVVIYEPNELALVASDVPVTNPNCVSGVFTCNGTITINIPAGSGTSPYLYLWPNAISNPNSSHAQDLCGGQYQIEVEDANGCSTSLQVVLTEPSIPIIDDVTVVDAGCNNSCDGEISITSSTATSFILDGIAQTNGLFSGICEGNYQIIVSNDENCSSSQMVEVEGAVEPFASFLFDPPFGTIDQTEITFDNLSEDAIAYNWTITGLTAPNEGYYYTTQNENFSHLFPGDPGQYEVCLEVNGSGAGCVDSVCNIIEIRDKFLIYVPNAFTPDGDAYNQTFKPVLAGFDITNFEMLIFNRWGELVFESHNSEVGWDGTFQGKLVQDGTYVWKINLKLLHTDEKRSFYGHVTVLR